VSRHNAQFRRRARVASAGWLQTKRTGVVSHGTGALSGEVVRRRKTDQLPGRFITGHSVRPEPAATSRLFFSFLFLSLRRYE
jgi:hypothetical protein